MVRRFHRVLRIMPMQLTVINKIKLGFGLFGCLLLITSILSYFGLNDIRRSAEDVVERKMPAQTSMLKVKTEILSLSVVTANGFHENTPSALAQNQQKFKTLSDEFVQDLKNLTIILPSNPIAVEAVNASLAYVENSHDMYAALAQRIAIERALGEKLSEVMSEADEASALMLDLSYLESDSPSLDTLIGAGTNIDNKLLTTTDSFSELASSIDAQDTANIIDDIKYQIKQKLNEIAVAQAKKDEALTALQLALSSINTLFDSVQSESIEGQNAILESVQTNLVKNFVVAVIGLIAAITLGVLATRSISTPLGRINEGLTQLSKGDLSHTLPEIGNDEFTALSVKVNSLTNNLRELVGNILEQEKRLITITKESVALGEKSLQGVDEQRKQVTVISTNTQDVQNTSRSNLSQINDAMEALHTVTAQSEEISVLVAQNRSQVDSQARQAEASADIINRLDGHSRSIGSILDVIKTIAEQTNLLALNAAI